ncbi:SRPBCC family protein [soil metagenome]
MTIAPIVRTVTTKASPARAFELFTAHAGAWWGKGQTIGKKDHEVIVIEPRAGGRWYEADAEGTECQWGKVLTWEPPHRLVLAWQLNSQWQYDPDFITELELSFSPADGGGTVVTLEHRDLECFGADAAKHAASLTGGWPKHMDQFAVYADANS